jgi:hypothetical protein
MSTKSVQFPLMPADCVTIQSEDERCAAVHNVHYFEAILCLAIYIFFRVIFSIFFKLCHVMF